MQVVSSRDGMPIAYRRVAFRPPKGLDKHLFGQLIDPTNIAVLGSEQHRTVICCSPTPGCA